MRLEEKKKLQEDRRTSFFTVWFCLLGWTIGGLVIIPVRFHYVPAVLITRELELAVIMLVCICFATKRYIEDRRWLKSP